MQSIAIAVCTLLGLGMLLFGSDFLDRHLTARAAGGGLGAGRRRDPAALVTAALTPTHVAPASRSAARSGAIEATAHEVPAPAVA